MNRAAYARRHEPTYERQEELFHAQASAIYRRTDRLFARLLWFQWAAAVAAALVVAPRTWIGASGSTAQHVYAAILIGGAISLPPIALARFLPGSAVTRHAIALAQACTSALLIHLTGGRIETHFHVFGSLAFLAFYRDWRVLITASSAVVLDQLLRGLWWPESLFGVASVSPWRWGELTGWLIFEDVFLIRSCIHAKREMSETARRQAALERIRAGVQDEVERQTAELRAVNQELEQSIVETARVTAERDRMEVQLRSAQKLEAVGQLASGIAHEINTPIQYVGDNTRFLQDAFEGLMALLDAHAKVAREARQGCVAAATLAALDKAETKADLAYLREEVPKSISQSLDGVAHVSSIVRAMKLFSHPGVEEMTAVDLNRAIECTATVCRNEWKYHAELELCLDPALPPVPCLAGEVNQVFLNVIVNAAHAIADAVGEDGERLGRITITTRADGDWAEIRVQDTGTGIPEEIRGRIFEPFFTTKSAGKGTGQGLAIAHAVVTQKHGGTIAFESEVGAGTTFVIRLPLRQKGAGAAGEAA